MNNNYPDTHLGDGGMEERLWNYIDGSGSAEERSVIEELLVANQQWKEKYHELLELHQLVQSTSLEEPSMRFTKNVMEEIAKYHIAPATKTYINKKIIWGIGTFFILLIVGFLIYGFGQIDWSSSGDTSSLPFDITKIDFSKIFSNTSVNIFMMVNVVVALMFFERYLSAKKKKFQKEA
jgi:hypothetical protein